MFYVKGVSSLYQVAINPPRKHFDSETAHRKVIIDYMPGILPDLLTMITRSTKIFSQIIVNQETN